MPHDRQFERILDLCSAALEVRGHERMVFLSNACDGDLRLRASVESVLVALKDAREFMEVGSFRTDDYRQCVGDMVGDCRLAEFLDQDALGATFRAEHVGDSAAPSRAVRVLRGHLLAREMIEDFDAAVKRMSRLVHPYLARVLGGGTTANGTPYLIYEWVNGVRIDDYCDRERLSVVRRMDLCRCVCTAVHAAHQHLVAGCNVTPANVLVASSGLPKLLDFASASFVATRPPQAQAVESARPVTWPADYAAPEMLLESELVTSSDVYALGVLMFHLLVGQAPYRLRDMDRQSLERTLRDATQSLPSAHVADNKDWAMAEAVAHRRAATPRKLAAQLRGEIDAMLTQAMAFDPRQRHDSAAALGQAISLWLDRQPAAGYGRMRGGLAQRGSLSRRVGLAALLGVTVVVTLAALRGFALF